MLVSASHLTNGKTEATSQSHKENAPLNPEVLTTSEVHLLLVSRAPLVCEVYPHYAGVPRGSKRDKQLGWELGAAPHVNQAPASLAAWLCCLPAVWAWLSCWPCLRLHLFLHL